MAAPVQAVTLASEIEWSYSLGGTSGDCAADIQLTSDGGCIIAGKTDSNDGDVSGNHGDTDVLVLKLNSLGRIVWSKCLGGTDWDEANSIQQTSDGGYIVAGVLDSWRYKLIRNQGIPEHAKLFSTFDWG